MNAGEGVEKTMFLHCWWKYKLIPPLWKTVWRFLKKLGLKPPYDPAIPLLGIYPKETIIEKKTHVFHCSFQHYLQQLKPRCPSTDEWIEKLWYIYTMRYYSAIKKSTFASVLMRWLNLKPIIQSEVSQRAKDKYHILMHIYGIQKNVTEKFICGQQWRNRDRKQICGHGEEIDGDPPT